MIQWVPLHPPPQFYNLYYTLPTYLFVCPAINPSYFLMNQLQTLVSLSAHTTLLNGLPCLLTLLFRVLLSLYWVKSTDSENGTVMQLRAAVTFPTATLTCIKTSPLDLSTC